MYTYNAYKTEKKWQRIWEKSGIYKVKDRVEGKKNFYHLVMFPYPSGDLHIGHWYNFAPADVYARLKRMQRFNVLSPIGFDAFGLPAENAAIKNGIHPKIWTYKNIAKMRRQLKSMGNVYDFSREVITADPQYYKWTQWIFLKMFEMGLAYKKKALANWCPKDQAILANEQVIDGKCWRHPDTLVIQKEIDQWMFKITDYAEDLINDLEKLNWPERTKLMQKNWIGKSKGAIIKFKIYTPTPKGRGSDQSVGVEVFTTRPDTLFGATYMVLSPEHPLVEKITTKEQKEKVRHYIANAHLKTELERTSLEKEKTGVFTGSFALNPANNEKIPVWVSDYVLTSYGTGAIMAVPAHDERDYEFAKKFNLTIKKVIDPGCDWPARTTEAVQSGGPKDKPYSEGGLMINSGEFSGLNSAEGRKKITEWLKTKGLGDFSIQYKMRDWIISRQRYWGAPIPIVYCKHCAIQDPGGRGVIPVPEKELPIKLPPLKNFKPVAGGKSPLARVKSFVNTKCPKCGGKATRETDTLDTFVDSSWYYLAYVMRGISNFSPYGGSPEGRQFPISKYRKAFKAWLPVNMYIGGAEHTVLHLLYSRFFTKALKKMGYLEFNEPFTSLRHQGIILGADGQKMSKSRGNIIDPDELVKKYGVDTVRIYLCFMSEYSQGGPWNSKGILGVKRFLDKIWNKFQVPSSKFQVQSNDELLRLLHQTIKKVGDDIENLRFNTAISALMILFNAIEKTTISRKTAEIFLKLLSPFAPYFTEELWEILNNSDALRGRSPDPLRRSSSEASRKRRGKSIHLESWPEYNPKLIETEEYELVIQINGKMRDKVRVSKNIERPEIEKLVLSREIVKKYVGTSVIKKIVLIPNRLINIVV
ncbi:MAG: leucine--tRNA ligase [bacterium]|nr:leucine--tRNA ligase [bacterium]